MKMNKKGFTLIEMLVVIAIIAILVSIVIPTVSSATNKAAAATNAANLRAVYAELQTDLLSQSDNEDGYIKMASGVPSLQNAPEAAAVSALGIEKGDDMNLVQDTTTKEWSVNYGGKSINDFATVAETGKAGS